MDPNLIDVEKILHFYEHQKEDLTYLNIFGYFWVQDENHAFPNIFNTSKSSHG